MSWTDCAREVMSKVRAEGLAAGKTPAEISKAIDDAYPFGERRYWPYKAWLKARKEFLAHHGLPLLRGKKPGPDLFSPVQPPRNTDEHTADLFGEPQ